MELYFAPFACSMATRIALYEAGAAADFTQVDTHAKKLADGRDFWAVNPMGQVPVLRQEDGAILTENPAILAYVADRFPQSGLMPAGLKERAETEKWLSFVGSELHVGIFMPLFDPAADAGAKAYATSRIKLRFGVVDAHLAGRDYLGAQFSVADAYLFTVLNWCGFVEIDLSPWPGLAAFQKRTAERPGVARAIADELVLYQAGKKAARN